MVQPSVQTQYPRHSKPTVLPTRAAADASAGGRPGRPRQPKRLGWGQSGVTRQRHQSLKSAAAEPYHGTQSGNARSLHHAAIEALPREGKMASKHSVQGGEGGLSSTPRRRHIEPGYLRRTAQVYQLIPPKTSGVTPSHRRAVTVTTRIRSVIHTRPVAKTFPLDATGQNRTCRQTRQSPRDSEFSQSRGVTNNPGCRPRDVTFS